MNRPTALGLTAVVLVLAACSALPGGRPSPSPAPTATPNSTPTPFNTDGPGSTNPPGTAGPGELADLDGREFVSVLLEDPSHQLVNGTRVRLTFRDGHLGASAGCNSLGGDYLIENGRLVVGPMSQTEMGCEQKLMDQDQWLASFLSGNPAVDLSGNDLVLTSHDAKLSLLDREVAEPDQPLRNITWGLSTIVTGEVASSVPVGITATLLFDDHGGIQFNDGCNSGGGKYVVEGNTIKFSELVSTDMACGGDAATVASAVLKVLNAKAVTFAIDNTTLTLQAGDDGLMYSAAVDVNG